MLVSNFIVALLYMLLLILRENAQKVAWTATKYILDNPLSDEEFEKKYEEYNDAMAKSEDYAKYIVLTELGLAIVNLCE